MPGKPEIEHDAVGQELVGELNSLLDPPTAIRVSCPFACSSRLSGSTNRCCRRPAGPAVQVETMQSMLPLLVTSNFLSITQRMR